MSRFRDIDRAEELMAKKNKIDAWRRMTPAQKQALYKTSVGTRKRARVGKEVGYVKTFDADPNYWTCWVIKDPTGAGNTQTTESVANLISVLRAATVGDTSYSRITKPPATATVVFAPDIQSKLARVTVTEKKGTLQERTSRLTEKKYWAYETNSVSTPIGGLIGGTAATSTFDSAKDAIKTSLTTGNSALPGLTVRFKPQGNISLS